MKLRIENMTCGGCARSISKTLQDLDPAAEVVADPPARVVEVRTRAERSAVLAALEQAGFPATPV